MTLPQQPVSLASALSCVNRSIQDMPIEHPRTALVYKKINQSKDQAEVKSRKDAVFLAQIRSGHCLNFRAYQHLLNAAVDPTCPRCGEGPLWNTGSWNVLELSQHDETFLVKWTRRWRFWRINRERRCWCHGAPFRAAASVYQTSVNNSNNRSSDTHLSVVGLHSDPPPLRALLVASCPGRDKRQS